MVSHQVRVLLDTNVFILGYLDESSNEARILDIIKKPSALSLAMSNELFEQIRRVGRRVGGKDWTGPLLSDIWSNFSIIFVQISVEDKRAIEDESVIPREDIGIYLTAIRCDIDYLVSSNHEFIRKAAEIQDLFVCLSPQEFIDLHLEW